MSYELVAIGASWGGLRALSSLFAALPSDFSVPIVVAQHRGPESSDGTLAHYLNTRSSLPVVEVDDKDPVVRGRVHLAPPDYHLLIEGDGFTLSTDGRVQHSRPSIDVLFESAADAYGSRCIGVILTGANEDGAGGLARIKQRGGTTIVEDPATAESSIMPRAAVARGVADKVLALSEIPSALVELCRGERRTA